MTTITDFAKDTFILFLREFFSSHDIWTYSEDETETKIQVCDDFTLNLETSNFRPAVCIQRRNINFTNLTLGQRRDLSFKTGKKSYTDLMTCDIIIQCISREGLEAERIGLTVFNAIHMTRDALKKDYNIFKLDSMDLGAETPLKTDSDTDYIMVPIGVRFLKNVSWSIEPIAPKLRGIGIIPKTVFQSSKIT